MKIRLVPTLFSGVAWLVMMGQMTGRTRWINWSSIMLLSVPLCVATVLIFTNPNLLFRYDYAVSTHELFPILLWTDGVWAGPIFAYAMTLFLIPLLWLNWMRKVQSPLSVHQIRALIIGSLLPLTANILFELNLTPIPGLNLTPFVQSASGLIIAWAMWRYGLFDLMPVARSALFEQMSDSVIVLDAHDHVVDINPAAKDLLGLDVHSTIGQSAARVFAQWPDLVTRLHEHLPLQTEIVIGESPSRYVDLRATPLSNAFGQLIGRLLSFRDITERKEVDRLKDEIVSTVSHELRTPLTSLRGFAELLLTRNFAPQQQHEMVSIIHRESIRLATLIDDFLDLQRMAQGRQPYECEPVALDCLLQETAAVFAVGRDRDLIRFEIPDQLPQVYADPSRIRQVLSNLLSNAIKFSPAEAIISLGARLEGNVMVVWVTDPGIGIPRETLPKLFTKFFRVDNAATRQIGGTGLGLALVKEIIEGHGGHVWVESTVGKGSTFFFTLALVPDPQQETTRNSHLA